MGGGGCGHPVTPPPLVLSVICSCDFSYIYFVDTFTCLYILADRTVLVGKKEILDFGIVKLSLLLQFSTLFPDFKVCFCLFISDGWKCIKIKGFKVMKNSKT